MKTVRHYATARDKILHIETDGAVVNIRVGLSDRHGNQVTSVEIIPESKDRGGDQEGRAWVLDGNFNNRLIRADQIPVDETVRPTDTCGCGSPLIWVGGHWEHDAAPYLWGDDHDAQAPEPTGPAREYWDKEDGVTE